MFAGLFMEHGTIAAAMIFAGLLGGFVAGLLGVGGGIVIVYSPAGARRTCLLDRLATSTCWRSSP